MFMSNNLFLTIHIIIQKLLNAHHFSSLPSVLISGIFAIFLFKNATDIFNNAYKN